MKAVLDTNVLVSGMINPAGAPGRLVDRLRAGALQVVVDDRIVTEYADVLRRPGMRSYFSATDVEAVLDFLDHNGEHVLATASTAGLPLVTGNKRHFPTSKRSGCLVLSPQEFLNRFCGPRKMREQTGISGD